jgi:hypothetical protein
MINCEGMTTVGLDKGAAAEDAHGAGQIHANHYIDHKGEVFMFYRPVNFQGGSGYSKNSRCPIDLP